MRAPFLRTAPSLLLLLLGGLLLAGPATPAARAQDAPPPPAAPDNRFFPKEMEDALKAMGGADPEDSFTNGLAVLARLRFRDGATEPMRKDAFPPVLEAALSTRLEHVASFAAEILAGLDLPRLATEASKSVDGETDAQRLFNAAVLLEECAVPAEGADKAPDPVDALVKLAGKGNEAVRTRAVEALGEVASLRRGAPEKVRERAAGTVLSVYGGAGKNSKLRNVCAVALGKIGHRKALGALLQGLGQTDGKHGYFAALALSWLEPASPGSSDASAFASLQSYSPSGGDSLEAWAKALDACAREENIESLVSTLSSGGKPEAREAAAAALGRLLPALPSPDPGGEPAGATDAEKERSALRAKAGAVLFDRMVGDPSTYVQWACFHALGRAGGPWLGENALKLLRSPNPDNAARAIHLCGDWKVAAAAKVLGPGIFAMKDELMRRRVAVEFWRIGDADAIREFEGRLRETKGGVPFARGCDALGSRRNPEAFKFALELLRSTREGSPEQFAVELCLEKMTGHFFGPYPGVWNKWYEKNPQFFSPRQAAIEREKWREEFDKENKGFRQTKETEKAVQMGLEYLARHQDQDGAWDPQGFRARCDRQPSCSASTGTRVQEDPSGRTGIAVLAFLGAGYTSDSGKFKTAIRRGLEYLMARQQVHGDYLTNDLIGGYNRPIALQAYAEGYTATHDPRYLPFVVKGVDFLTQIQNSIGGWRYRVEVQTSDSSVAAWMLFAMKGAEKAGVEVRPVVYEGCRMLFERYSVRVPKDGPREDLVDIDPSYGFEVGTGSTYEFRTGYQDQAYAPTHATTALGLMSHILLGFRRSHPFCIGSANHIVDKQMPEVPKDGNWDKLNIKQEYPIYFLYYGTLAMHQMGGKYFREWNAQVRAMLPGTQIKEGCSRGSWQGKALDGIFGSIYTTATGVMTMETYYRYLPVLQD